MTRLTALRVPPRLVPGDRVAVVATSGPLVAQRLHRGAAVLASWGLEVAVGEHALATGRHHAGSDRQRADDLQRAWCDVSTRAVIVGRGGSGAARIVDLLDWEAMAAAGPRWLVGFSDVTVLHQAVANRLGLATLWGPMAATAIFAGERPDEPSRDLLRAALFAPEELDLLADGLTTIVPGRSTGVLVGGTLALLANTVGTPEHRPAAGGIALLEDVGEPAFRLDSMLTQLLRVSWFDDVAGIALGSWTDCGEGALDTVVERLAPLGVPMVTGLGFGHSAPQLTVPLGVRAELDATAGRLSLSGEARR